MNKNRVKTLISLLSIIILTMYASIVSGDITIRDIEINNHNAASFEINTCYKGKSIVFIDMGKPPLFTIPSEQVANISLSYKSCFDFPDVMLTIKLKDGFSGIFKNFTSKYVKQQFAILINGEPVGTPVITAPLGTIFSISQCLSYEKAVAIIDKRRIHTQL